MYLLLDVEVGLRLDSLHLLGHLSCHLTHLPLPPADPMDNTTQSKGEHKANTV